MAWELEKCLTYHFIAQSSGKSQMVMNEEATMARRGLGKILLIQRFMIDYKLCGKKIRNIYYHEYHFRSSF